MKRSLSTVAVTIDDIVQGGYNVGAEGLECYALSAYGNYLRLVQDSVSCDMFADQLCRGNYLKIANFTFSAKSRKRFEKGDMKNIIKLNPSSKVIVTQSWKPLARPIFFPKDTVASLRLRMQMRYETRDVAVVCIGDMGENNGAYRITVTDGMNDEDTIHVPLDGSFRPDYEQFHRKFTTTQAACVLFKNLSVNLYEHCFRAERHTIIVPIEQEDIVNHLQMIFNKRVNGKVDMKKIRQPILDCVIYDDCNEVTNVTVTGLWIFSVTGENENHLLEIGKKDRIRLLSRVNRIGTFSVNFSELVGIDDLGPPQVPMLLQPKLLPLPVPVPALAIEGVSAEASSEASTEPSTNHDNEDPTEKEAKVEEHMDLEVE
ncbi:hypothetical protein R1sor_020667 [Riccia sorocarpa]|uniref:Uncharacterized protein n=1 Tax=Riccia sorocarpa TaxID=122646 RepID=A0ABD3GIH5_9MARC